MAISAKATLAATALALVVPSGAAAAEFREQPLDTRRTDIARVEWSGGPANEVLVEYRSGLWWVPAASGVEPQREADDVWSSGWQPGRESPAGTYRIRVATADETIVSNEFEVRPCDCVVPRPLRSRWDGKRFRIRLTAEYAALGGGALRLPVETGRPLVRVLRDARRVGSVRLRYRRGAFRGTWPGPRGPRHSLVFELVSMRDAFGNR